MTIKERNTFSLNFKTQRVVSFIESEKAKTGKSKTSLINELLESLAGWSTVLTSHLEKSSILEEIKAVRELLNDDVIKRIPHLATLTRRNPVQMLLYLVERGIEADEQLAIIASRNDQESAALVKRSNRRRSDVESSSRNAINSTAA